MKNCNFDLKHALWFLTRVVSSSEKGFLSSSRKLTEEWLNQDIWGMDKHKKENGTRVRKKSW